MSALLRSLCILVFWLIWTGGCAGPGSDVVSPEVVLAELRAAWQRDQHAVWEMEWPGAPLAGPMAVEVWLSGPRRRFEMLESGAPALVGETLVSDGRTAWLFNRFADGVTEVGAEEARFSPLSDALLIISAHLAREPRSVRALGEASLPTGPAHRWRLIYPEGTTLDLWLEDETGLISAMKLAGPGGDFSLTARLIEPLDEVPEGLFRINQEWVNPR